MLRIFFGFFLSLSTLLAQEAQQQALPSAPEKVDPLTTCQSCHGAEGVSEITSIPILAGQYESYLLLQLKHFRQGEQGPRYNAIMYPSVQELSDQELEHLATYFSKQNRKYALAEPRDDLILGERIYKGGIYAKKIAACSGCHSATGLGNEPYRVPSLAGQHAEYLSIQLKNYRDGTRKHAMMSLVAEQLSDNEIDAVANYLQGLQPISNNQH